jgi:hypothetical protein
MKLAQATLGQSVALARLEMLNTNRGKTKDLGYLRTEEQTYKTRESQQSGNNLLHKILNAHKISAESRMRQTICIRSKGGQFIL